MCRKLCDGLCVLLQEWPGRRMDGRSIQNKNIVLKWGRTSLNLFSSDYYYKEVLICYRETGVGRKETVEVEMSKSAILFILFCHVPISPEVGSTVHLAVVVGSELLIV